MDVTLSSAEQVTLRISPADAEGTPRGVLEPIWALESGDGTLTPAEDGLSAVYVSADGEVDASAVVSVSAKPDLTGVSSDVISDSFNLTITGVAALATTLGLSADTPTPKA